MLFAINFADKPENFREALNKYLAKKKVASYGILCELGIPNLHIYREPARRLWRMRQTNPALVCVELNNPEINDERVTFTGKGWGPCRDRFEHDSANGREYRLSVRYTLDEKNRVKEICAFDVTLVSAPADWVESV